VDRVDLVPIGAAKAVGIGGLFFASTAGGSAPTPLSYLARDAPGGTGEIQPDGSRLAKAGHDRPGHVIFGPYAKLASGSYRVKVVYAAAGPRSSVAGSWDVVAWRGKQESRVAEGNLSGTDGQKAALKASFLLPPDPEPAVVEVRVLFPGSADVSVASVLVTPAKGAGAP
jgi:hypothetical protein